MRGVVDGVAAVFRQSGLELLIGATLLLAGFALCVALSRSSATRHRLAGLSMLATGGYLLAALLPLPRLSPFRASDPAPNTARIAAPPSAQSPADPPAIATSPRPAPLPEPAGGGTHAGHVDPLVTGPVGPAPDATAAAPHAATSATGTDLAHWLAWAGIAGAGAFTALLLLGWLRLARVLRTSRPAPQTVRALVALPSNTRVRIATLPVQPFCCGVFRATIVLPAHLAKPCGETRFVLLHELAHVRTGDVRRRVLAAWLRPLLFWHPLFWWLSRQLRFHGELVADRAAAGGDVAAYVRCMVDLANRSFPFAASPTVATIFRRRSELFRRLEMMLQRPDAQRRSPSRSAAWLSRLSATAAVALCAGTFGVAQEPAQGRAREQQLLEEISRLRTEVRSLSDEVARLQRDTDANAQPPVAPTAVAPQLEHVFRGYMVAEGDTLPRIAKAVYGSADQVDRLLRLNPDLDPNRLQVGAVLRLEEPPSAQPRPDVPATANPDAAPAQPPRGSAFAPSPRAPANYANADAGRSSADDARLVTQCIELRGEVDIQKVELARAEQAMGSGTMGAHDVEIARIRLRTKQQQSEAIADMVRSELQRAEAQLSQARQLAAKGYLAKQELQALDARADFLRRALR